MIPMRRLSVLFLASAVVLLGFTLDGRLPATAQEGTPVAMAGHPIVGAWVVDTSAEDPTGPQEATVAPNVSVFTDEGLVVNTAPGGGSDVGAWEATSARGAALTFVGLIAEEDFAGTIIIRATVELDATGDSFSGPYSYTVVAADGTVVDAGRDMVSATRITVEPVEAEGTPLAAIPTWMPEAAGSGTPTP
jgi:hypothetical protein